MLDSLDVVDHKPVVSEIRAQYLADARPWIIGFSGGKDSTTVLQMVFYALADLPTEKLSKAIHVLLNDTLVENPAIAKYADEQLRSIERAGAELFSHNPELFKTVIVRPKLNDTFWVTLIGKGYPSPNRWFRWCTERLKINPTTDYILDAASKSGEVIIVLGSRKAESANRAASMRNYDNGKRLRQHTLSNAFVYTPISDLSNDEVWAYLLEVPNPWGSNNTGLLKLYNNTCDEGECPLVIETGTPSCGKSRFGCWVCTVVDRDRSMENMIQNGAGEWLKELLSFRNWLQHIRQQTSQHVPKYLSQKAKFGPFLLKTRRAILDRLLDMQDRLQVDLIAPNELDYVRELLQQESEGAVEQGLKNYVLELSNGSRVAVVSDFDVLRSRRTRIGPIHLKRATLVRSRRASSDYLQSTRVMYHQVSK